MFSKLKGQDCRRLRPPVVGTKPYHFGFISFNEINSNLQLIKTWFYLHVNSCTYPIPYCNLRNICLTERFLKSGFDQFYSNLNYFGRNLILLTFPTTIQFTVLITANFSFKNINVCIFFQGATQCDPDIFSCLNSWKGLECILSSTGMFCSK